MKRPVPVVLTKGLERARTFLEDSLLPATSTAVERTNRRHRKMQKTVYRVRTGRNISGRISMDMLREAKAPACIRASETLHSARAEARAGPAKARSHRKAA